MIRTRCRGLVGAMIPSRLCCRRRLAHRVEAEACGAAQLPNRTNARGRASGPFVSRTDPEKEERDGRVRQARRARSRPTGWRSTSTIRGVRVIEVDEDTQRIREGAHPRRRVAGTGPPICTRRSAGSTSTRPGSPICFRRRRRGRHDGRAVRRQQQLVRRLRLLAAQAPRLRQREAAERRPQEVGAREPRADPGGTRVRADRVRDPGEERPEIRALRDEVLGQGRSGRRRSWTSARPRSTGARSSPPTTCPRSSRRCPGTSRRREHPVGQGGQRRRHVQDRPTSFGRCTRARASLPTRRSSPTAGSASARSTRGSPCTELLGYGNVKNYDGSWTEYGSLVGAPRRGGLDRPQRSCGVAALGSLACCCPIRNPTAEVDFRVVRG